MKFSVKNESIQKYNGSPKVEFPKYTSQLMNLANQNAQGTRPKVVGQLSDLFPEFQSTSRKISITEWEKWYLSKYPNAIKDATNKIQEQVNNLKHAIELIDEALIEKWVRDLVIYKTYNGFYVQQAILASLAEKTKEPYRLATPAEEAKGIDGFVGRTPYSIKPHTYKVKGALSENINEKILYYSKTKTGISVDTEE